METEEGRSEHLQSIDNRRTGHFYHWDIRHPIDEAVMVCIETLSEASWNIRTNAAKPGMVYQHGSITFSHFTDRMIP
jgi:hypothetical protein